MQTWYRCTLKGRDTFADMRLINHLGIVGDLDGIKAR